MKEFPCYTAEFIDFERTLQRKVTSQVLLLFFLQQAVRLRVKVAYTTEIGHVLQRWGGNNGSAAGRARFPHILKLDSVPSKIIVGPTSLCCLGLLQPKTVEKGSLLSPASATSSSL